MSAGGCGPRAAAARGRLRPAGGCGPRAAAARGRLRPFPGSSRSALPRVLPAGPFPGPPRWRRPICGECTILVATFVKRFFSAKTLCIYTMNFLRQEKSLHDHGERWVRSGPICPHYALPGEAGDAVLLSHSLAFEAYSCTRRGLLVESGTREMNGDCVKPPLNKPLCPKYRIFRHAGPSIDGARKLPCAPCCADSIGNQLRFHAQRTN
jgi:hypothetical protein